MRITGLENVWLDPASGKATTVKDIIDKIKRSHECSVHVGTDSHRLRSSEKENEFVFATAICIYTEGAGGDYYFKRDTVQVFGGLHSRIMEEVSRSVTVGIDLMKHIPNTPISVHADINSNAKHKTFHFLSQIRSWILSAGFSFQCKPNAWASSGVADKHAK